MTLPPEKVELYVITVMSMLKLSYRITSYLCDPENCAFWQKIATLGFYLCVALHGVWLSLCELYLCDFHFIRINA